MQVYAARTVGWRGAFGVHSWVAVKPARAKAYTAASFRTDTAALAEATQPGRPQSGIRSRPDVAAVGGGLVIEAGGSLLGGIGVSGAPGGKEDELCAAAGIEAIREDIEL